MDDERKLVSNNMTEEEKAAAVQQSRETLERLKELNLKRTEDPLANLPPAEDRVARWRREADERDREYEQGQRELRRQEREARRQDAEDQAAVLKQQQEQAVAVAAASRQDEQVTVAMLTALNASLKALAGIEDRLGRLEKLLAESNKKAAEITDVPGPFLKPRLVQ
jgi:hypothetical protein